MQNNWKNINWCLDNSIEKCSWNRTLMRFDILDIDKKSLNVVLPGDFSTKYYMHNRFLYRRFGTQHK